jgi:hypothetical protein
MPLILPVVSGFFDSLPSFLLVRVFVPFTQLYIHPSFFCSQSFHFFTGIPVPLVVLLFLLLLLVLFLFSPAFSQYSALFSSIHFVFKLSAPFPAFTLSLFLLHSFLTGTLFTSSCSFHPPISARTSIRSQTSSFSSSSFLFSIPSIITISRLCALSVALSLKV